MKSKLEPLTRAGLRSAARTLRGRIKMAEREADYWGAEDYRTALGAVEMLLKITKKPLRKRGDIK